MTTTTTGTADKVAMPTNHSNWRKYTHREVDLIFMHPDNANEVRTYLKKLEDYLLLMDQTLGQMADDGPKVWLRGHGLGRKTTNAFIRIINNLEGKEIVFWPKDRPEKVEFDQEEEDRKKQLRAAVYEMRMNYHKSWKEIADMCGVSPPTVRLWDKQHRLENNLPSKYVDSLNQQLVDLRIKIRNIQDDFYILARYLRNNGHHEVAHLIEQRLGASR